MTNVDAFRIVSFSCCCSCALSLSLFSVFIQKNCFKAWKQMFLRGSSLKCIHLSFRQIWMAPSDGNRENAHTHTSNSDKYSLLFVRKICLNNNCYKVKSSRAVCCRFLFQFFIFIFNSSIRCIFSGFSNFISLYYFDLFFCFSLSVGYRLHLLLMSFSDFVSLWTMTFLLLKEIQEQERRNKKNKK